LFFTCCVAHLVWSEICEIANTLVIADFESVGRLWVRGKKGRAINALTSAVIWALWKLRNHVCFQGKCWSRVELLLREVARLIRNWALLNKPEEVELLERWALELEQRSTRPPRLEWHPVSRSSASDEGPVTRAMSNMLRNNDIAVSVVSSGIGNLDNLLDVQSADVL
jgi:hypothetical protein